MRNKKKIWEFNSHNDSRSEDLIDGLENKVEVNHPARETEKMRKGKERKEF